MSGKNLVQMQDFLNTNISKNYLGYENNFCQQVDLHGGNKIDEVLSSVIPRHAQNIFGQSDCSVLNWLYVKNKIMNKPNLLHPDANSVKEKGDLKIFGMGVVKIAFR